MRGIALDLIADRANTTWANDRFDLNSLVPGTTRREPLPGRPKAAKVPLGGSAAGAAAQRGGLEQLPGRSKAAKAPLGGSAACEAAQRGGLEPLPGRPKAAKAPVGGSAACEAAQRGGHFL